jgi:hypothetical protein
MQKPIDRGGWACSEPGILQHPPSNELISCTFSGVPFQRIPVFFLIRIIGASDQTEGDGVE